MSRAAELAFIQDSGLHGKLTGSFLSKCWISKEGQLFAQYVPLILLYLHGHHLKHFDQR